MRKTLQVLINNKLASTVRYGLTGLRLRSRSLHSLIALEDELSNSKPAQNIAFWRHNCTFKTIPEDTILSSF